MEDCEEVHTPGEKGTMLPVETDEEEDLEKVDVKSSRFVN